ncbi:MAG TPA: hypothetical protein VJ770_12240 [Stellaceae bacterium]|nr:hypothetical protein [Stellaceae bacterium]
MKKSILAPDVEKDLQLLGVEGVRDLLRASTDGFSGTSALASIQLPNSKDTRGNLLSWIQWQEAVKACRENWRFWWTLAFAAIAAVAAVIAVIEGWPHS